MAEFTDNCGYWLYLGENDVPKEEGKIKPIATDLEDSGSWDLSGRPVLDYDAQPLSDEDYDSGSKSTPRILTRAEKGQALTHLEMDFNLASLLHKVNTSSVSSSFDPDEDAAIDTPEVESQIPYRMIFETRSANADGTIDNIPKRSEYSGGFYGPVEPEIFGPYRIPVNYTLPGQYYSQSTSGRQTISGSTVYTRTYELARTPEETGSLYVSGNAIVQYFVYVPLERDQRTGLYEQLTEGEPFYLRTTSSKIVIEDDQPVEIPQIIFTPFESPGPGEYGPNTGSEEGQGYGTDIYFERHKPTRDEEHNGLFATFSYAPVKNGDQTIIQNGFQTVKVQHTADEIRYKLANEIVPGTLDVAEDFHVTGSAFVFEDMYVTGSTYVKESIHVSGSTYIQNDTNISGSLHVSHSLDVKGNISSSNDIEGRTLMIHESGTIENSLRINGHTEIHHSSSYSGSYYNVNPHTTALEVYGDIYVHGRIFGNISTVYSNTVNPGYAETYQRFGTQDTGSQSDAKLKNNREEIREPLNKMSAIHGYEFDWAPEAEKQGHDVGLVAQELREVLPEAVSEGQDGYLRIDYVKVIPLLVEAVKSLTWEVDQLKRQIR